MPSSLMVLEGNFFFWWIFWILIQRVVMVGDSQGELWLDKCQNRSYGNLKRRRRERGKEEGWWVWLGWGGGGV